MHNDEQNTRKKKLKLNVLIMLKYYFSLTIQYLLNLLKQNTIILISNKSIDL